MSELIERWLDQIERLLEEAADARAEAEAAEARMKHTLSTMATHYRGDGLGMGEAEHKARASKPYTDAMEAWIIANARYRKTDATADAARLKVDVWRTAQSTERAKMQLR